MTRNMIALAAAALAAGCAPQAGPDSDERALAEARPAGEPLDCIELSQIRHSRVRDDQTIDFYTSGSKVFRNRLRNACPGLGFEDSFTYRTSLPRLCSMDVITVSRNGNVRGPTCGLGSFQPIQTQAR